MNFKLIAKRLTYIFRKKIVSGNGIFFKFYLNKIWKASTMSEKILYDFFERNTNSFILQVGANDGFVSDPIYKFVKKFNLKGLVIEPQKVPFEVLKQVYYKNQITVVNYAIDKENSVRKLYKYSFSDDRWASGKSSFNHDHLLRGIQNGSIERKAKKYNIKLPENKNEWITFELVETMNFNSIFERHHIEKVNVLIIDTEGFDYEIIKMFDFSFNKPELIIFENTHIPKDEYFQCKEMLDNLGYQIQEEKADTVAILK